jgi:hypothetical protein
MRFDLDPVVRFPNERLEFLARLSADAKTENLGEEERRGVQAFHERHFEDALSQAWRSLDALRQLEKLQTPNDLTKLLLGTRILVLERLYPDYPPAGTQEQTAAHTGP